MASGWYIRGVFLSGLIVVVGILLLPPGAIAPTSPISSTPSLTTSPMSSSTGATSSPAASVGTPAVSPALASEYEQRIREAYRASGLPSGMRLEPNFGARNVLEHGVPIPSTIASSSVQPGPTGIGVNDLGLRSTPSGRLVPYSYRSRSFEGTVAINHLALLDVMNNASDAISLQLNTVLNGATIFGNSTFQWWTQNTIFYSLSDDQFLWYSAVFNFSQNAGPITPNSIYAHAPGGEIVYGLYLHATPASPPAYTVRMPFVVTLYINSTNIEGRNAVFFNYSLSSASAITLGSENFGRSIAGSYDYFILNSTANQPSGYRAPPAYFLVSGSQLTGIGLRNDAEIMIGGPDDGLSSIPRDFSGSAQLLYLNSSSGRYTPVPAAFTTTADTGESVIGVDVHYTTTSAREGRAYLTNGPEFIYGLWNATAVDVSEAPFYATVSPWDTYLWVSPSRVANGSFDAETAAWAISPDVSFEFWLPTGADLHWQAAALANDYRPLHFHLSPATPNQISLKNDPAEGLYTPVIAYGNSEVAALATSGDGTATDPFILEWSQHQPINEVFGQFDVFFEPLYPGLLLEGVTAHVTIRSPPSFRIDYMPSVASFLEYFGLPTWNDLPMELYHDSDISIVRAANISGWFPFPMTGFLMASLYISDSTHILVAYNHFVDIGSSLVIVNSVNTTDADNTVFGNVFSPSPLLSGPNASSFYQVIAFNTTYTGPPAAGSIGVFSEGNLIYNNLVETPITAYSPPQNPLLAYMYINNIVEYNYSAVRMVWHNLWNISYEPASYTRYVNGISLTGSIVGGDFQGGNAWTNWNGSVPYTDQGLIYAGGDFLPLPLPGSGFFAVQFHERGLPSGTLWHVRVNGLVYGSRSSTIVVYAPMGTYAFRVSLTSDLQPHPAHGTVRVRHNLLIEIHFSG